MRKLATLTATAWLLSGCQTFEAKDRSLDQEHVASVPAKEVILEDLKSPWSIAFISDSDALITEKAGELLRVDLAKGTRAIVRGFPNDLANDSQGEVFKGGNNGMFDIVLDPEFHDNGLIYVSYSAHEGSAFTTKVIRGKLDGTRLENVQTLFVATPFTENERYHYGGGLLFGRDGRLYVTISERLFTEADQPEVPIAQDLADKRGKIYRLNRDGSIPLDNPNFGDDAVPGIFALGIRAAQGLALHPETGEIWFTEHGTHQGDEVNILAAGSNYGWPIRTTGRYRFADYNPPEMESRTFTDPVWYWRETVAPTGPVFYSGTEFPEWEGDLIVPGLSIGSLCRLNFEQGQIVSVESLFANDRNRARKVAQSPNGSLYMLTDTHFSLIPGRGLVDHGGPDGQLVLIKNAAR